MFDTARWRELGFRFEFKGLTFAKETGEVDYEIDGCQYEFLEDTDIPVIPTLLLALFDASTVLEPFAAFDDGRAPEHLPITTGSSMARKQLTIGDCRRAREVHGDLPREVR